MSAPAESGARYVRVREPLHIKGVTIPNRIVRTAHGTGLAGDVVSDDLIAFHARRAAGGVGLIIQGDGIVHASASGVLKLWKPTVVSGLRRMADAIHHHGSILFQQLSHQGAAAMNATPPWSVSAVPLTLSGRVPIAMTHKMIEDVALGYAASARHCRDAGMDGVEVHAGHGFLQSQFLSPLMNDRTDEYGGSFGNRLRFLRQIIDAIRTEVGSGFPLGVRLSVAEAVDGGLEATDSIQIAKALEADGNIDFFDLSYGHLINYPALIGGMHEPHGYQIPTSALLSAAVALPTIVAGRIHSLDEAESILARGIADLVALTRPTIAEPDLVRKSLSNQVEDVRPCTACNDCVAAMNSPVRRIVCSVNPSVGHEAAETDSSANTLRTVLVVGAGPAGLEAARTASAAGHRVVLYDQEDQPGGALRYAASAPHRSDLQQLVDWQVRQLVHLGVDTRFGCLVDIELIHTMAPDVVVVATGAVERLDGLQIASPAFRPTGLERAGLLSPADVHAQPDLRPETAVVVDDLGTYAAIGAAEQLAENGARVAFVTRFGEMAAGLGPTLERAPAQRRLSQRGVVTYPHSVLEAATRHTVTIRSLLSKRRDRIAAEVLVLSLTPRPRRDLVDALQHWDGEVHVIGDALAPRDLRSAIADGNRVGSALARIEKTLEVGQVG